MIYSTYAIRMCEIMTVVRSTKNVANADETNYANIAKGAVSQNTRQLLVISWYLGIVKGS